MEYTIEQIEQIFDLMQTYQINTFKNDTIEITKQRHKDKTDQELLLDKQNKLINGMVGR